MNRKADFFLQRIDFNRFESRIYSNSNDLASGSLSETRAEHVNGAWAPICRSAFKPIFVIPALRSAPAPRPPAELSSSVSWNVRVAYLPLGVAVFFRAEQCCRLNWPNAHHALNQWSRKHMLTTAIGKMLFKGIFKV